MNRKNLPTSLCFLVAGLLFAGCSKAILKPEPQKNVVQVAKAEVTDSRGNKIIDQLEPKEKYRLSVELVNPGQRAIPAGKIKVSSVQPEVRIEKGNANFKSLAPQERTVVTSPIIFSVSKNLSLSSVAFYGQVGEDDPSPFKPGGLVVPQSEQDSVEVVDVIIDDSVGGNGDGRINPGEQVKVRLRLKNIGSRPINPSQAIVTALQPGVTIVEPLLFFPFIAPKDTATSLDDFTMVVDPDYPDPNITVRVKAASYNILAFMRVYRDLVICIEDFRIVRGGWNAGCTREPDLLKIRLAICNERSSSFSNATAKILANSIYLCGRNENLCTAGNINVHNEKVYFGQLTAYECAQAKSPCENNQGGAVPFTEEFIYTIDLKDPSTGQDLTGKHCFSFAVQLFKNVYSAKEDCQSIDDGNYERKYLCYSYTIPPIPPCPYAKK